MDVAQLFHEQHPDTFLWVPEANTFFIYDGRRWTVDVDGELNACLRKMIRDIEATARIGFEEAEEIAFTAGKDTKESRDKRRNALARLNTARKFAERGPYRSIVEFFKELPGVRKSLADFDTLPNVLNVRNGVLSFDEHGVQLYGHERSDYFSKVVHVDYDETAECPRWERFLAECFPDDPSMADYLQRLVGYSLLGRNNEHIVPVLYGPRGRNGKSTFINALSHVFAEFTKHPKFSTFTENTKGDIRVDLVDLKGARFTFTSEGDAKNKLDASTIKGMSGADPITARLPYAKEQITFRPVGLIWVTSNFAPKADGSDDALFARLKLIEWGQRFVGERADKNLEATLRNEARGILRWAVEGAVKYLQNGLGEPEQVQAATEEYKNANDPLYGFLPGVLVIDELARMAPKALYDHYTDWCEAEKVPERVRYGRNNLNRVLRDRGVPFANGRNGKPQPCVRLANEEERAVHGVDPLPLERRRSPEYASREEF
ncbi:DNA primase family protein [Amycolatopsis methanolica]|uniref:DNA primase family protein n=1 Tax=Amycolatopsis methanolica TaxID=1814 RepID=UPI00341B3DB4